MITPQIIYKNTFYLTISQIANRSLGVVLVIVLTRYLGPENYGSLMLSVAYMGIFGVFIDASLDIIIIRETSRNPNNLGIIVGNGIMMRCIFALAGYALASIILPYLNYSQETVQLFRLAILILFISPFSLFRVILLITQKIKLVAMLDSIGQLIKTICVLSVVFLQTGKGEHILLAQLSAAILASIFYVVYGFKVSPQPISFHIDHQLWASFLKQSWPIMVASVVYTVQWHVGQLIIGHLLSNVDTGLYSVAFNLSTALFFLPSVYFTSIYPVMSKYFASDLIKFRWLYRFSFRIMIVISLPISLFISLTSKEIISFFAGDEYLPAASLIIVLIWGLIFQFSGTVLYYIVLSTGKQYILTPMAFFGIISYIILLFICISAFGLIGSSIASLVTYMFMFAVYGIIKATRLYILDWFKETIIPIVAVLLSFAILIFFHPPTILIWPLGLAVYIATLLLIGVAIQPKKQSVQSLVIRSLKK